MAADLTEETVPDLKVIASDLGIERYSSMNKAELIKAIEYARAHPGEAPADAAADAAAETTPDEGAEEFPIQRLINESHEFFGAPRHVVAGALSAIEQETLTVEAAQEAIQAFGESVDRTERVEPEPEEAEEQVEA